MSIAFYDQLHLCLKQPSRITCGSASFTDHILACVHEIIFLEDVINVGSSDNEIIYCNRKITRIKTGGVHKRLISVHLKITTSHNDSEKRNIKCIMLEDNFAKESYVLKGLALHCRKVCFYTAQKLKFSNMDFFSKCHQIPGFLRI